MLGASWYLLSIERHASCWKSVCRKEFRCFPRFLDCHSLDDDGRGIWDNSTTVFSECDPNNDISFNYGIFEDAITKNVVTSKFLQRYFYCLWWGLQNLRCDSSISYAVYLNPILNTILLLMRPIWLVLLIAVFFFLKTRNMKNNKRLFSNNHHLNVL